jgi:hypothetical protein
MILLDDVVQVRAGAVVDGVAEDLGNCRRIAGVAVGRHPLGLDLGDRRAERKNARAAARSRVSLR